MPISTETSRIIDHINATPGGATTLEIKDRLHIATHPQSLAARMGKMFAYGLVDRVQNGKITRWTKKAQRSGDRTNETKTEISPELNR